MLTSDPEEVFCSFEGPGEVAAPVSDTPRFMDPVSSVAPQPPSCLRRVLFLQPGQGEGRTKAVRYACASNNKIESFLRWHRCYSRRNRFFFPSPDRRAFLKTKT